MISEAILRALSRSMPESTEEVPSDLPLAILQREYPDLGEFVSGKRVLDFGCGGGAQAAAIAKTYGATVTGIDTNIQYVAKANARYGSLARFISEPDGSEYDVVISQNAMEHFPDPCAVLSEMIRITRPSGFILITFGPPWFAPFGSHMQYFCPVPWLNLLFPERSVMAVRGRYQSDGAKRYVDVEGGLNKMSIRKFERLIGATGLSVVRRHYTAVKKVQALAAIPILRELFINHATVVLRKV